jgi:hypothetical protein
MEAEPTCFFATATANLPINPFGSQPLMPPDAAGITTTDPTPNTGKSPLPPRNRRFVIALGISFCRPLRKTGCFLRSLEEFLGESQSHHFLADLNRKRPIENLELPSSHRLNGGGFGPLRRSGLAFELKQVVEYNREPPTVSRTAAFRILRPGFHQMRELMLNHGLDQPLLATDTGNFQITFPGLGENPDRIRVPATRPAVRPPNDAQLNERQRKML